jgi:hypothetical protein
MRLMGCAAMRVSTSRSQPFATEPSNGYECLNNVGSGRLTVHLSTNPADVISTRSASIFRNCSR